MFSQLNDQSSSSSVRAVTFLGEKISLSIIGNTLTFYPSTEIGRLDIMALLSYIRQDNDLKYYNVSHDDLEHGNYHLDSFDIKKRHYHQHFEENLDSALLSKFLDYFLMINSMSENEKENCLQVFEQANSIAAHEFEKIITSETYNRFEKLMRAKYSHIMYEDLILPMQEIFKFFENIIKNEQNLPLIRRYINALKFIVLNPDSQDKDDISERVKPFSEIWKTADPEHANKILNFFESVNNAEESDLVKSGNVCSRF